MPLQPFENQSPPPRKSTGGVRAAQLSVAAAGIVLGAAVWALSPSLSGVTEAWDHPPYYITSLFIAGLLAACCGPRQFWLAPLGIYVGQTLYAVLFLPGGPLWMIGMVFGAASSIVALAGAAVPFVIRRLLRPRRDAA